MVASMPESANHCSVDDCDDPYYAKGYCKRHYRQNTAKVCKEDGCGKKAESRGWCQMHYERWRQHGDADVVLGRRPPDVDDLRWCSTGAAYKPLSEFDFSIDRRYVKEVKRYASSCRACKYKARNKRRADDPEVRLADRLRSLKRRHGPEAPQWYEDTFIEQGGGCAICGNPPAPGMALHVDHDHRCCPGKSCGMCLRGLLCNTCNRCIGLAYDDTEVLLAGAAYLLDWKLRQHLDLAAEVRRHLDAIRALMTAESLPRRASWAEP